MKNQKLILSNLVFLLSFLVIGQSCVAETKLIIPADHYKLTFEFALRAPAIPIILSDYNFSIWSPYDILTEGNVQHWISAEHSINYILYNVRSTDEKEHNVQLYVEKTLQFAVYDLSQAVVTEQIENNEQIYLKTDTVEQAFTKRSGDGVRIDWGYVYLTNDSNNSTKLNIGDYHAMKHTNCTSRHLGFFTILGTTT